MNFKGRTSTHPVPGHPAPQRTHHREHDVLRATQARLCAELCACVPHHCNSAFCFLLTDRMAFVSLPIACGDPGTLVYGSPQRSLHHTNRRGASSLFACTTAARPRRTRATTMLSSVQHQQGFVPVHGAAEGNGVAPAKKTGGGRRAPRSGGRSGRAYRSFVHSKEFVEKVCLYYQ